MKNKKVLTLSVIILLMFFTAGYTDLFERAYSFSILLKKSDLIIAGTVIDVKIEPDKYIMTFKVDEYIKGKDEKEIEIVSPLNKGFYLPDDAYIEKGKNALLFLYRKGGSIFITNYYGGYLKPEMKSDVEMIFQRYQNNRSLFTLDFKNDLKNIFNSFQSIESKRRLLLDLENVLSAADENFILNILGSNNIHIRNFGIIQSGKHQIKNQEIKIKEFLINTDNLSTKLHCLVSLGYYKNPDNLELIQNYFKDDEQSIRRVAAEAIGKIEDEKIIEPLKSLYSKEDDFGNRMTIITAVNKLKNKTLVKNTLRYFENIEYNPFVSSIIRKKINEFK